MCLSVFTFFPFPERCISELQAHLITSTITGDKRPDEAQKMGACSLVSKYGCMLALGKKQKEKTKKKEVRATDLASRELIFQRPRRENTSADL